MRYLLPFLLLAGCAAPAQYQAYTGPNCYSLDPAYYETLTDDQLHYCLAVTAPPPGGYVVQQQPQAQLPTTITIFGPNGSTGSALSCYGTTCQQLGH